MTTNPEASFDITKLLKEFDPGKVVAEFSNALKQYKFPNVDLDSLVASQKKSVEALTSANRVAFEGLQGMAKRQAEILQDTMNEASKAADQLSKAGSPPEVAAKQEELTKSAFERALANMRELAEMVSKANQDATYAVKESKDVFGGQAYDYEAHWQADRPSGEHLLRELVEGEIFTFVGHIRDINDPEGGQTVKLVGERSMSIDHLELAARLLDDSIKTVADAHEKLQLTIKHLE